MINGKGMGGMLRVDESVTSRHTFYPHIAAVVAGGADVAVCSAHVWRTALSSTRWPNQRRQDNKKKQLPLTKCGWEVVSVGHGRMGESEAWTEERWCEEGERKKAAGCDLLAFSWRAGVGKELSSVGGKPQRCWKTNFLHFFLTARVRSLVWARWQDE